MDPAHDILKELVYELIFTNKGVNTLGIEQNRIVDSYSSDIWLFVGFWEEPGLIIVGWVAFAIFYSSHLKTMQIG